GERNDSGQTTKKPSWRASPWRHPHVGLSQLIPPTPPRPDSERNDAESGVAFLFGRRLCSQRGIKYLTFGGLVARRGEDPGHRGDGQDRLPHRACPGGGGKRGMGRRSPERSRGGATTC